MGDLGSDSSALLTVDAYLADQEESGKVPAVYAGRAAALRLPGEGGHWWTLDEVLSTGEVAGDDDDGELSDGEVVTVPQEDLSFVRAG